MPYHRLFLVLVFAAVLATGVLARSEPTSNYGQLIEQPTPEFPKSELRRGREGWVLVTFTISEDGLVVDPGIEDSSGSDAFNKAAISAVRDWRYEPAEEHASQALVSFVYDRWHVYLSRKFISRNAKVHQLIENGELDHAQERIDAIRDNDDLTVFELAYTFITEGRVAGERGDKAEQLRCFRRAMLNQGRWVKRENYLKLLRAAVILEIQQKDFTSALRDYALLNETGTGRKIAADLAEPIEVVKGLVDRGGIIAPPYKAASIEVSIEHEATISIGGVSAPESQRFPGQQPTREPAEQ